MIISIQILCLFSFIYCAEDTISLNKIGCLYMDKISSNDEIISFEYIEGYYRAIHANYAISKSSSVKMEYLGDSTNDIFLECSISPNNREIAVGGSNEKYHYHIPCYISQPSKLKEGTYCIEIVGTLIGDIKSENFCSDQYTFKVVKSTNLPNLNVIGFSSGQQGCVKNGDKVTLLATVKNQVSEHQDFTNLGIGLSNTETVTNNIALSCKIEGGISVNSQDKIICIIPSSLSLGVYTILYSNDLLDNYKCPLNVINNFNSLNFGGEVKKLQVFQSNSNNIRAYLANISISDSLNSLNSFNLTFTLNNIQNNGNLLFENINQIDIGIKLIDKTGSIVRTKCSLITKDTQFDLNCKVESYNKNTKYSILIEDDITIGYDKNDKLCTQGSSIVYNEIVIAAAEYNFFIIFNDESTSLDCNQKQDGFSNNAIENARNICGSCTSNCLFCSNKCIKCLDGFELTYSSECNLIKDRIDYSKFLHLTNFTPFMNSCYNNNKNEMKLFTFQFSYFVTKGENVAFQSEDYFDGVFAKNENNNQYGLNCHVDVNPAYAESDQYYGICKESSCELNGYVNCSFKEKPSNGKYNIIVGDTLSNLGKLIEKAKVEYGKSIEIKFITNKIKGNDLGDKIQIVYQGYAEYSQTVYVCPFSNAEVEDCYELSSCTRVSYDQNNNESILECSKTIKHYYQKECETFKEIMILDDCYEYINDEFNYKYCPNSSRTIFINVLKIFFISIFLI